MTYSVHNKSIGHGLSEPPPPPRRDNSARCRNSGSSVVRSPARGDRSPLRGSGGERDALSSPTLRGSCSSDDEGPTTPVELRELELQRALKAQEHSGQREKGGPSSAEVMDWVRRACRAAPLPPPR